MATTRTDTDLRRATVLAAAKHIFARIGVRDDALPLIAEEAGIGLDALARLYPTRDDLLRAVLAEQFEGAKIREARASSLDALLPAADDDDDVLLSLEATLAAAREPGTLGIARRHERTARVDALELLVRRAQERDEIERAADPRAVALALAAWELGVRQLAVDAPGVYDAAAVRGAYDALLHRPAPAAPAPVAATAPRPSNRVGMAAMASAPADSPALPAANGRGKRNGSNVKLDADMSALTILAAPPKTRGRGGVPLSESFGSAVQSLGANKTRSILTMLGIIIGVMSVITLLAVGNGVTANVTGQLLSNGTNLIYIQGASASQNGVQNGNRIKSLTLEDAAALAQPGAAPDIASVSPEVQTSGTITVGNANAFAATVGVQPAYLDVHDAEIGTGDFITTQDVSTNANVAVLGPNVADKLFASTDDPIGKNIQVQGKTFRVIGVLKAKGGTSFGSADDNVYVPVSTAFALLIGDNGATGAARSGKIVNVIIVKGASKDTLDAAAVQIADVLNFQHRTRDIANPDFQVTTQKDLLKSVQATLGVINVFLAMVAGISLLVGGIGIMNIMLVSVTERTREIGIRKAIGAKERDILTQFIVEAILISLIGAMIGIVLGFSIAALVSKLWQPSVPTMSSVVASVVFAIATGLFFGVYPARRAARLKPIDALRYE